MAEKFVEKMMRGLGPTVEHRGEIIVIGLGRFGSALSHALIDMGYEVLGLDLDPKPVQEHIDVLTHVAEADTTNVRALRQLGVADATTVIVCIGADIEASVLTTAALFDLNVPNIWAKAMTEPHGRILSRVGAHNVVFPEAEMGARVAHLVTGQLLEYLALDEDFVLVEMVAPASIVGVPLGDSNLQTGPSRHDRVSQAGGRGFHACRPRHGARSERPHRRCRHPKSDRGVRGRGRLNPDAGVRGQPVRDLIASCSARNLRLIGRRRRRPTTFPTCVHDLPRWPLLACSPSRRAAGATIRSAHRCPATDAPASTDAADRGAGTPTDAPAEIDLPTTETPAETEPPSEPLEILPTGPYGVGVKTVIINPGTDRPLTTDVWFPLDGPAGDVPRHEYTLIPGLTDTSDTAVDAEYLAMSPDGPFPLVVYSHGSGGLRYVASDYTEAIASYGYIVASADHTGNTALDGLLCTRTDGMTTMLNRVNDVQAIINELTDPDSFELSGFVDSVDPERIAVTGHSLGGFTTYAAVTGFENELGAVAADERVDAIIPLAPAIGGDRPPADEADTKTPPTKRHEYIDPCAAPRRNRRDRTADRGSRPPRPESTADHRPAAGVDRRSGDGHRGH